jgi:molecular chaperone GrpE (heat shock protein)
MSPSRLSSPRDGLAGPLAAIVVCTLAMWGCAPATAPKPPAGPVAGRAGHDDHDHDHDHDHAKHDHGDKDGKDAHGDHDHPETLAEGVAELETLLVDVGEKLGSGAKDAADDAVHAAGHLLEDLRGLLEKQELAADLKEAGGKAIDELFECFDKLDVALHAGADAKETPAEVHASLEERFKAALGSLKERFATRAAAEEN